MSSGAGQPAQRHLDRALAAVAVGAKIGLAVDSFAACVMAGRYLPWAAFVTERAIERGVSGTPSVYVAGMPAPANARTIAAAVAAVAR